MANKMRLTPVNIFIFTLILLEGITYSKSLALSKDLCPNECVCEITDEGLHKVLCYGLTNLYEFSLKNKYHNINIIDLSYSSISKINNELDKFTDIVSLDLSHNQIKTLNNFLHNCKKLVFLNLSNNFINIFSSLTVPSSVSSLDLSYNSINNIPSDLILLKNLKHFKLKGNPIDCSCKNIRILNELQENNISIDNVKCVTPFTEKDKSWQKVRISKVCSNSKYNINSEELMLGDQPQDVETISPYLKDEKNMEMVSDYNLNQGIVLENKDNTDEDADEKEFLGMNTEKSIQSDLEIFKDGSGDADIKYEEEENMEPSKETFTPILEEEKYIEGSGDEGSGILPLHFSEIVSSTPDTEDYEASGDFETTPSSSTEGFFDFRNLIPDDFNNKTRLDEAIRPSVFREKVNWDDDDDIEEKVEKKIVPTHATIPKLTTEEIIESVTENLTKAAIIPVDTSGKIKEDLEKEEPKVQTATYVCVALIILLVVGLIGISIIKHQKRKKRDKRILRQQRKDIEKAGKEMVDMNKSLLGKPAIITNDEAKMNGNYELVPTIENHDKENGNTEKRKSANDVLSKSDNVDSLPIKNGNMNKINGASQPEIPHFDPNTPVISITPLNMGTDAPEINTNGYPEPEPYPIDFLPIIPPIESGRVKIKLTETPKPKTPVLVTRSRSNAGDIIITPTHSPTHKNVT